MTSPRLSVIVTCYDLGAYLEEALASIDPGMVDGAVEVIVVDDGSKDPATVAVLDALDTTRYHVIRQENMGLAKARNNGIRAARGEYIIPFDADNRMLPAMITRSIAILDAEPDVDVVYGDAIYFGERSGTWTMGPHDLAEMIERNRIDACACFRKSIWERVGGYDERMGPRPDETGCAMGLEDWDLWLRCICVGAAFRHVPEHFFAYRVRGTSMVNTTTKNNRPAVVEHIFNKPELRFLRGLREAYMACHERERQRPELTGRDMLRMMLERIRGRIFGMGGKSQ